MAAKARKVKPIPVEEEEELFEDLEEIGEEEEAPELEELEEGEELEEEEEPEEEEEEVEVPPRRKAAPAKKAARKAVNPEDPKAIIQTVLVEGILAYMDQQISQKVSDALAAAGVEVEEEAPAAPRRKAVAKPTQKAVKRVAATPAKKTTGKPPATSQEVREWLQTNGYEVSERGRISEQAKNFYTKKTGRPIAR